jgi:hypothetical protein
VGEISTNTETKKTTAADYARDRKPTKRDEVQKQVDDPDRVHPVNVTVRAALQHFADASQHVCHAESEND